MSWQTVALILGIFWAVVAIIAILAVVAMMKGHLSE